MKKISIIVLVVAVVVLAGVVIWQNWLKPAPAVNNQPEVNQPVINEPVANQPENCAKEGEISNNTNNLSCCDSLTRILNATIREDGQCIFESGSAYQGNPNYACTACGNGVCGTGENKCNCPADCK